MKLRCGEIFWNRHCLLLLGGSGEGGRARLHGWLGLPGCRTHVPPGRKQLQDRPQINNRTDAVQIVCLRRLSAFSSVTVATASRKVAIPRRKSISTPPILCEKTSVARGAPDRDEVLAAHMEELDANRARNQHDEERKRKIAGRGSPKKKGPQNARSNIAGFGAPKLNASCGSFRRVSDPNDRQDSSGK